MDPNLIEHPATLGDLTLTVSILPVVMASTLLTFVLLYLSVTVMHHRPLLASLGLSRPEPAAAAMYTFLGGVVALSYVFIARAFPPSDEQMVGGPLSRLAESGPAGLAIWFLLAVFVAPVMEELLFRGYAFLGARRRLGSVGAGAVITVVFVALHITETGSYLPALAGITTISTVLILVMIRSSNLAYCITCHLGYNATLALLAVLGAECTMSPRWW